MAFGILEDRKLSNVPGTGPLSAKIDQASSNDAGQLKRGTGKYSHIVLLPQPSDDPCDPLNWPRWKKEACFFTIMFTGGLFNTVAVLVSSAYVLLAEEFHVSVNKVVSSFCGIFLGSAIFVLIQNPLAVKYGHRVVYLLSAFLMFISCVWSPLSTDLVSVSASRVLQGAAMAPLQCLVPVTIEHIYFVHERGSRSSIWGLFQFCAPIIGGVINTYVTQKLSWKLGFWFTSIACGLCFLGVIFFVPETTYNRQSSLGRASATSKYEIATARLSENNEKSPKLPTFFSQVKIHSGTFSEESIWKIFLRPFPFLLSPVTWFIFVSVTMPLVCTVFLGLCTATIYTITYGFDATDISLTGVASFVGIIPALIVAGPLSDRWIVWMAQRNRGIYEPEYRLVFMLCMLVGVLSFIGWAIGYERHMPWIGAVGCATMMTFSIVVSYTVALAYLIDTRRGRAARRHAQRLRQVRAWVRRDVLRERARPRCGRQALPPRPRGHVRRVLARGDPDVRLWEARKVVHRTPSPPLPQRPPARAELYQF